MNWINNFDYMIEQEFNKLNYDKEIIFEIKNEFKQITENGDKYKWLLKKISDSGNSKNKFYFSKIYSLIDDYQKNELNKLSTKKEKLIINKIYSRKEISVFSNNADLVSGVLNDKNNEDSNDTYITIKLNNPYIYHLENRVEKVHNEYDYNNNTLKYYAYTKTNASNLSVLQNIKNKKIMNASGLYDSGFIYAFICERKNKYKYIGKFICKKHSNKAPFYFELVKYDNLTDKEIINIANENILTNIDIFNKILDEDNNIEKEEKCYLIKMRCNQGLFRNKLLNKYNHKCPLTNMENKQVLIASHIKPWAKCSSKKEKLDQDNGILLSALADKLFDKGLITFSKNGNIIYSKELSDNDINIFKKHLYTDTISLNDNMLIYMKYHNENIFLG